MRKSGNGHQVLDGHRHPHQGQIHAIGQGIRNGGARGIQGGFVAQRNEGVQAFMLHGLGQGMSGGAAGLSGCRAVGARQGGNALRVFRYAYIPGLRRRRGWREIAQIGTLGQILERSQFWKIDFQTVEPGLLAVGERVSAKTGHAIHGLREFF
ncbi:hypothetical protein D3C85_1051410 [compost metagenome]